MPNPHPDETEIECLASGRLQGSSLLELLSHLAACTDCSSQVGRAILASGRQAPEESGRPRTYGEAYRLVTARGERAMRKLRAERRTADREIVHLLDLPDPERRRLVRTTPRFRSYSVVQELLARSEACWFADPVLGEELTEIALLVSDHLPSRTIGRALLEDLRAEVWVFLANVRRIRSDYRGAADAFERAEEHLHCGTRDASEEARLRCLYAAFLRDLQRLDEARSHVDQAVTLYRETRDRHLEARALISKSNVESGLGNLDAADSLLDQAARGIDRGIEPRLTALIRRNRALRSALIEDRSRIQRSLEDLGTMREPGYLDRLRTIWVRGMLLEKLGRLSEATRNFLEARRGFLRAVIPVDVALLDLDLARIHLSSDRPGDALRHATSAFPILASRGRHQDTLRALDLFRRAGGLA